MDFQRSITEAISMAMGPMSSALSASITQAFQQVQASGVRAAAQGSAGVSGADASRTSKTDGLPIQERVSTRK